MANNKIPPFRHPDGSNCWTKNCSRSKPKTVKVKTSKGLSIYETERIGISVELAVADIFAVHVNPEYRKRGEQKIISHVRADVRAAFGTNKVPKPVKHIAEAKNPVDFKLEGDKTLSVKSNMRGGGMVAPQRIGQPTSKTFWAAMSHLAPNVDTTAEDFDYEASKKLFKVTARNKTKEMLDAYWKNLFDCDYLLYVEKVLGKSGDELSDKANVSFIPKKEVPKWDQSKISFTRDLSAWNESCTLKYDGVAIGEWQVHNNRDCFKFRFNMSGLKKAGLI